MRIAVSNASIVTDSSVIDGGTVVVESGVIVNVVDDVEAVGPVDTVIDIGGRRLAPGFVDIQVNGGGGVLFNADPSVATITAIVAAHTAFGTTSMLPTLISDDAATMQKALQAIRDAVTRKTPGVLGIHLEGPYLNSAKKGAHDAGHFCELDEGAQELVSSLGGRATTLLTLAPEKTTPAAIHKMTSAGIIVFAGHTAATYEECVTAEDAGLSGYTHLFNAMTSFSAREPGVVGAALASKKAVFGIIADGHHVHPAAFAHACLSARRGGALLVTDAMPTVGAADKSFYLNGERITSSDGVLRNAAGSLAGSDLSMIEAVRNTVSYTGIGWDEAVRMASTYPALAIGRNDEVGSIRVGCKADFVELSGELDIRRVWRGGEVAYDAEGTR